MGGIGVADMAHQGWTCLPLQAGLAPFHDNILDSIIQEKLKDRLGDVLGGIGNLPDDDRGDLDRVSVGVVDLQPVGLEVADPNAQAPPVGQRHRPPQARAADGADIGSKEPHDLGMARLHDDQRAGDDHRHHHWQGDQTRDRAGRKREADSHADSDDKHAGPAADRPRRALADFDTRSGMTDRCRLGRAGWLMIPPLNGC